MHSCLGLIVLAVLTIGAPSETLSETVYFLVAEYDPVVYNDCYVLPLTEPSDIEHARMLVKFGLGIGQPLVVADYRPLFFGKPSINRNYFEPGMPAWSWYVTSFLGFSDVTPEIYDGWPTGIENGLVDPPKLGFWSYTVVEELGTNLEPWNCNLDVDEDVDLKDFAMFAAHWGETGCGHRYWCGGADLNHSKTVDMGDLAIFARNWLWYK